MSSDSCCQAHLHRDEKLPVYSHQCGETVHLPRCPSGNPWDPYLCPSLQGDYCRSPFRPVSPVHPALFNLPVLIFPITIFLDAVTKYLIPFPRKEEFISRKKRWYKWILSHSTLPANVAFVRTGLDSSTQRVVILFEKTTQQQQKSACVSWHYLRDQASADTDRSELEIRKKNL